MSERSTPSHPEPFLSTTELYRVLAEYQNKAGLLGRWSLYDLVQQPLDYYGEAFDSLQLSPNDRVLDVGCFDGYGMLKYHADKKHTGEFVGLDINPNFFLLREFPLPMLPHVYYVTGLAERLPFRDNSFDGATALFMLYHVPNYEAVLQGLQRVVRPGGRVGVWTSGADNLPQRSNAETKIARLLRRQAPSRFTDSFDIAIADRVLPQFFSVEASHEQLDTVDITPHDSVAMAKGSESLSAFNRSLDSRRRYYAPLPGTGKRPRVPSHRQWEWARRTVVTSMLEESGHVIEEVHRKLYVCRNDLAQE